MSEGIGAILDRKIADIKAGNNAYATGRVRLVREYTVEATGLEDVSYFERVTVGEASEGYVDAIRRDCVFIALTRVEGKVRVGDRVTATGREYRGQFSPDSVGHVVDMFGNDRLAGKRLAELREIPVESPVIPIMERTTVNRPLLTGISGIDLMYPIGRGQRQLIIGDKKTGKTQIALDTIVNQAGKNETCIYVAIGKTKKEVKEIYGELLRRGAMEYTILLAAFNDDCAPVLRSTPYAALSIARTYLDRGEDVLVGTRTCAARSRC